MRSLLLLLTLIFISCSLDDGKPSGVLFEYDQEHAQMVKIIPEENEAALGTDDSNVKFSESPKMNVNFTYSFSISKNEVTRKEYAELMGKDDYLPEDSGSFPQVNVTYYDAVLYANARSLSEGFDTAYTYSSAIFNANGNCSFLEGLLFDSSKEAYRLPTEAEWVFVASQNWKPSQGWNNLNSDYRVHDVCTADINALSICDMAGNVMEWVNDWLGNLLDTTLTNFVGAPDGGSLGQRVVKGGSFKNAPENISLYSRGDVYAVTSSTKSDYVGFRLAFGSIPSPVWVSGSKASLSRISIEATSSEVKMITGTYHTKLVFVDNETENLAYIDFSNATLSVTEIQDTLPVFHPDISPDGKSVAFCTKSEGVSGTSEVYVRDLNPNGTNLVKLNVPSAAIPRFRILPVGDTVIVYVSDAGNNKEEGSWKEKSTWQVPFSGGKFGTPVKLFDGSYHGGFSEDGSLVVTGARLLRANVNGKESLWYNGEQACNASLSRDSTKQTLFLDFGSKTGKDYVGESYSIHERLLIADSIGNLIQSIAAPKGYTFDHTEWSNYSNIAVSSVANVQGAHKALYLISTRDSSLLKLAEGNELWHPSLWVNKQNLLLQTDLDLDSLGVYMTKESVVGESFILRYKMELLWKYYDSVQIAIIGSSRSFSAVNPFLLTSGFGVNFSHVPNDIYISEYFIQNYFLPLFSKLKTIVVALDLDMWYKIKNDDWFNYYRKAPGFTYDYNHNFWKDGVPKVFLQVTENSWGASSDQRSRLTDSLGYIFTPSSEWGDYPQILRDSINSDENIRLSEAMTALENIIHLASASDVNVVGVIFPLSPMYRESGAYGRYGLRRSRAETLIEDIKDFEKKYSNFRLFDENKFGLHDYDDSMAENWDHLSSLGATQLTSRLDSLLKTLP